MGHLNLLKGSWTGKVGQTVGAKWKDKQTLRTYSKPSNPNTPEQQKVRSVFGDMTAFSALFADIIKYDVSLDTRGQSVRNAIIQANKAQISTGTFDKTALIINKGGLPNVTAFTADANSTSGKIEATFDVPPATNISAKANIVVLAINETKKIAQAVASSLSASTAEVTFECETGDKLDVYYWIIDKRGSAKVGSRSGYLAVTAV